MRYFLYQLSLPFRMEANAISAGILFHDDRNQLGLRAVPVHSGVLNSWKEIATYLGRGVRTVQRWEAELQLPVHGPRGNNRSAVIAFREELDHWLARTPLDCDNSENKESSDALRAIAQEMQELALQLFAAAESQTQSEKGKLVETAGTILQRLALWMSRNSGPNGFDNSRRECGLDRYPRQHSPKSHGHELTPATHAGQ
jgi:hypothetical protein